MCTHRKNYANIKIYDMQNQNIIFSLLNVANMFPSRYINHRRFSTMY